MVHEWFRNGEGIGEGMIIVYIKPVCRYQGAMEKLRMARKHGNPSAFGNTQQMGQRLGRGANDRPQIGWFPATRDRFSGSLLVHEF